MKRLLFGILISICGGFGFSQVSTNQYSFELSSNESGSSKEYIAQDNILFKAPSSGPGFIFSPSGGVNFKGRIDENMVAPLQYVTIIEDPEDRILDTSLAVGTLPGVVDVSPTGAATYQIPIMVPPGTAGVVPNLSIVYNSQAGNGLMGIGWNISGLSAITRVPRTIYFDGENGGVNLDANDRVALDGQRLIYMGQWLYGAAGEYKTEVENYSRITLMEENGNFWWRVITKEGTVMEYGHTEDSRIEAQGQTIPLSWCLNRTTDKLGNYLDYIYHEDNGSGEFYISEIKYTGNLTPTQDNPNGLNPYNTLKFVYCEREDNSFAYVAGSRPSQKVILKKIKILDEANSIVREYRFDYKDYAATVIARMSSHLSSIELINQDGSKYNSTNIYWGPESIGADFNGNIQEPFGTEPILQILSGDFFTDGKSDLIVFRQGTTFDHFSVYQTISEGGNVSFSDLEIIPSPFNNIIPKDFQYSLPGDFDGNGRLDFLVTYSNNDLLYFGVCLNHSNTDSPTFQFLTSGLCIGYLNHPPPIRIGDFNGDGKDEIFIGRYVGDEINQDEFNYLFKIFAVSFHENGTVDGIVLVNMNILPLGWNPPGHLVEENVLLGSFSKNGITEVLLIGDALSYVIGFDNTNFVVNRVYWNWPLRESNVKYNTGDFNGDGLTDIFSKNNQLGTCQIGIGKGSSNAIASYAGFELFPSFDIGAPLFINKSFVFPDINGDGFSDIIVEGVGPNSTTIRKVYFSIGDGTFWETVEYNSSWTTSGSENRFFGDFNGDGKLDILYKSAVISDHDQYDIHFFCRFSEERRVRSILNGLNFQTDFEYKPLTIDYGETPFYQKEYSSIFPAIDFKGALVAVSKITSTNLIEFDQNEKFFYYKGAKIHAHGKGFLGFREIVSKEPLSNSSSVNTQTLLAPSYFSISAEKKTFYQEDLLSRTTQFNKILNLGNNRVKIMLDSVENEDFIKKTLEKISYDEYDSNGNLTLVTNTSKRNGGLEFSQNVHYYNFTTQCVNNPIPYLPGIVIKTSIITGENPHSREIQFQYNAQGLLFKKISDPTDIKSITLTIPNDGYDVFGNVKKTIISANELTSRTSETEFDSKGRFAVKSTNALDQFAEAAFDPKTGNVLQSTDINGLITKNYYDGFGNLTKSILPSGNVLYAQTKWSNPEVDPAGTLFYSKKWQEDLSPSYEYFDALGRSVLTKSFNLSGQPVFTKTIYNAKGQVEKTSLPYFSESEPIYTQYFYDELGRSSSVTEPTKTITYSYSVTQVTTTNITAVPAQSVTKVYDSMGNLVTVNDNGGGGEITYSYFSSGKVKSISHGGHTTLFDYDLQGNQVTLNDPDAGISSYEYNAFGELTRQIDGNLNRFDMTYDILGRIVSKEKFQSQPLEKTTYSYDNRPHGLGVLGSVVNMNGPSESYYYDELGRMNRVVENLEEGQSFMSEFEYDKYGNVTRETYPTGFAIKNEYQNGFLKRVKRDNNALIWEAQNVDEFGNLRQFKQGNYLVTNKIFTPFGYLTSITTNFGSVPRQNMNFNFTPATGNLESRSDNLRSLSESFGYDNLDRLTSNSTNQQVFTYNSNGTIASKTGLGDYAYNNNNHQLIGVENLEGIIPASPQDTQKIAYTSFNKVDTILENGYLLEIKYNVNQQRYKSILTYNNQSVRTTWYAGGNYERETANGQTRHIYYVSGGDGLAAIIISTEGVGEETYYVLKDHLGSIYKLVKPNGTVACEMSFDAWGRRRNPEDWTYENFSAPTLIHRGFTMHEHLDEFALINMNGRVYDPVLGVFLSPDNYVQAPNFSQNFNRYAYCFNNPMKYTDPSGYWTGWDDVIVGGIGFVYGYVSYGLTNGDWGWNAVAAGAISAGTFLLGYYSGGATSAGNIASGFSAGGFQAAANTVGLAYAGQFALCSTVNNFMPSYTLGNNEKGMVFSPSITPGGIGFNATAYVNTENANFSLGINSGGDYYGGFNYRINKELSIGWYRTNFAREMSQGVGGISIAGKDWSFRLDEDHRYFNGDGDDRFRTGGFELTINNLVFGGRVITNSMSEEEKRAVIANYSNPFGKVELPSYGVYENGRVLDAQFSFGFRTHYGVVNYEHHNNVYQHFLQNRIHDYFATPYFPSTHFNYSNVGSFRYNPYSIYYY